MTFIEGLLSFISPCILPMVPVYLIYLSGERRSPVINSLGFVLGFSVVFIALGVCAGSIGAALAAHRKIVNLVCAAVIALLGLSFIFNLPLPFKGMRAKSVQNGMGLMKAILFGMIFSVALTPCVGAFLGAALMTAASEGGALKGAILLAEYSAGLAIPFVLSAIMIKRLRGLFAIFSQHSRSVSVISGVLLLVFAGVQGAHALPINGALGDRALPPNNVSLPRQFVPNGSADTSCTHPASPGSAGTPCTPTQPSISKEKKNMEITLNAANFEAEVLKSEKPVIVDFWATWCGPCRMLAPELEALAKAKGDTIKVGKVNVDENPELCAKYGIMSIPAIFVFKNGKITAQSVGYQKQADLEALLAK